MTRMIIVPDEITFTILSGADFKLLALYYVRVSVGCLPLFLSLFLVYLTLFLSLFCTLITTRNTANLLIVHRFGQNVGGHLAQPGRTEWQTRELIRMGCNYSLLQKA